MSSEPSPDPPPPLNTSLPDPQVEFNRQDIAILFNIVDILDSNINDNRITIANNSGRISTLESELTGQAESDAKLQAEIDALKIFDQQLKSDLSDLQKQQTSILGQLSQIRERGLLTSEEIIKLQKRDIEILRRLDENDLLDEQQQAELFRFEKDFSTRLTDLQIGFESEIDILKRRITSGEELSARERADIRTRIRTVESLIGDQQSQISGFEDKIGSLRGLLNDFRVEFTGDITEIRKDVDILTQEAADREQAILDKQAEEEQFLIDNPDLPDDFFSLPQTERDELLFLTQSDEFLNAEAEKVKLVTAQQEYQAVQADTNSTPEQITEAKNNLNLGIQGFLTSTAALGGQFFLKSLNSPVVNNAADALNEDLDIKIRPEENLNLKLSPDFSTAGLLSGSLRHDRQIKTQLLGTSHTDIGIPERRQVPVFEKQQKRSQVPDQNFTPLFENKRRGLLAGFNV